MTRARGKSIRTVAASALPVPTRAAQILQSGVSARSTGRTQPQCLHRSGGERDAETLGRAALVASVRVKVRAVPEADAPPASGDRSGKSGNMAG
jgi:hypothetical protein